ncbi:hypothetical protein CC78DRAFT_490418 [Lojkania enalia]|uniref:Polyketide synthase n=1 Tax=Lojkania enalia TaxID=147567 RepID=A0A9P4KF14_9PLEO|nr:hypothetical protein CC78DRAFT_490418 [Didymosphaeria enalia]
MAMRLPGGIKSAEDLWEMLINKRDGRSIVPSTRYNVESFHSSLPQKSGMVTSKHGYYLQDELEYLDAAFFSMNKAEVAKLDPQQRLLLEVVWECMESAGQTNWRGKDIGCYVGVFGEDWLDLCSKDTQHLGMYRITGSGDFAISNRVSYEYDLKGPSMTIRTGCSSALIGLHEACQALYNGDCSSAIVAGTNIIITPTMSIAMTEQGVLSPTGSCKTFDAAADGYARGEAINAIYIKRLSDAIRDSDPIRAVIRATSTNCDGKTPGIAYPSSESHEQMIRRAYQAAQLDIPDTGFFECHGTGTAVGDPLETVAIANVLGGKGAYIGSVKPNVGHSEGASGITSLIKAVLALEHKLIPPNINFSVPNPKIPFEKGNLRVPLESTQWPKDREARVSVNSFGIGGANAHVVIDSAEPVNRRALPVTNQIYHSRLMVFSGNSVDSLRRNIMGIEKYLKIYPNRRNNVAHTLGVRRDHLKHRAFSVVSATSEWSISNFQKLRPQKPSLTFVFTGQGSQWPRMGSQLMETFESFRHDIAAMDDFLRTLDPSPEWQMQEELLRDEDTSRIDKAEFSQPLCTAIQIALVNLLRQWEIHPSAVVGHSSGEIAAAYAANAISMEAAIAAAYYRGQVTKLQTQAGAMAAVGVGREEVIKYLTDGVVIACQNSPQSVTLSGDADKIDIVLENLKTYSPESFSRRLRVEMAYHSHHMQSLGPTYEKLMATHVKSVAPDVPFFSSVSGELISELDSLDPSYWRRNMEQSVLFHAAIESNLKHMDGQSDTLFVEIGPHSTLSGPLRQIFRSKQTNVDPVYVPTMIRTQDGVANLLTTAGTLYQYGVDVAFGVINGPGNVLTDLPTYSWHHDTKYWSESRVTEAWRLKKYPHHELLGSRMLESTDIEPTWRNIIQLEDISWLRDHKVAGDIVFPCAGYVAIVGEAIRQTCGSQNYTLRRLVVKTALVLREADSTELVTSLRQVRLTDHLDSLWYEFTISSCNGGEWVKHCVGQARANESTEQGTKEIKPFPRKVLSSSWYLAMQRQGLQYGPRFRSLQDITAHPSNNSATAALLDDQSLHESVYTLHPTIIDQTLQLFTVAMSGGIARRLGKLAVPASIGEIHIGKGGPRMAVEVKATVTPKGVVHGEAVMTSEDNIVLALRDGIFAPLETGSGEQQDSVAATRLDWKPDIDFMDLQHLIRPRASKRESLRLVEKLALLCIIESNHCLRNTNSTAAHFTNFSRWLELQSARIAEGGQKIIPEAQEWALADSASRLIQIEAIAAEINATEGKSVGAIIRRIMVDLNGLSDGTVDPLELLMRENGLTDLYAFYQEMWDCSEFFSLLGHAKPTLRVLEIGAGTGGTTAGVLQDLTSTEGRRLYSKYTFTDISSGFFVAAKERFREYEAMEFSVLDISKDPIEQGYEAGGFDLIIASNVLHATPQLHSTLQNVRALLAPHGRLFLQELCPEMCWIGYIMGILPGWWLGANDERVNEPFVTKGRWDKELREAGLLGIQGIIYDDESPFQVNATMVAHMSHDPPVPKAVTLLHGDRYTENIHKIEAQFSREGYTVTLCTLEQPIPASQSVIALFDLEESFFGSITEKNFGAFQQYLSNTRSNGTLWITKPSQIMCEDPRYGLVLGMARTIRSELSCDFATLEIDKINDVTISKLIRVYEKFQTRLKDDGLDPEYEYALQNDVIHIGRYHWISAHDHLLTAPERTEPKRLEIRRLGLLDSLFWTSSGTRSLDGDEVEVTVHCVGLNFKDILVSMGIVDGPKDRLGLEGSGVIRKVGPNVRHLQVGDRVMISDLGCFATRIVTSSKLCARIPDNLTFEGAATMPCVYSTVIHSLVDVAQLAEGQSVLIHSACGGVGLAALQVCKMMGAQVFATVGNEEKVRYLMDNFRIPRDRIFDSRSTSFASGVLRETNGKGVDVVLNSLSGELLHASWQCVAKFGKMLEIGKRDFIGHALLAMDVFESNRSFHGIDLAELAVQKPEALLEKCLTYYRQGSIEPIIPLRIFEASQIGEAFRYMQKGQHTGKIVIRMPKNHDSLPEVRKRSQILLKPNASYLLVGGLGGLGRSVSTWLVENGARHLVYLSRTAGSTIADQEFFEELRSQGCHAVAIKGSATKMEDVQRAIVASPERIAGVLQMSMVLRDRALLQLTYDDWNTTLAPKVDGTWNLHRAFDKIDLDFFVLFSSISGIVGQWGQANYAAANTFLDSFVRYRRSMGQAASVVDVGVMEDVGYVSQNPAILEQFRATGAHTLREEDLLEAVHIAINESHPQSSMNNRQNSLSHLTIGLRSTRPLDDPGNRTIWRRDRRMALYRNLERHPEAGASSNNMGLIVFLNGVTSDPTVLEQQESVDYLTKEICRTISSFMLQPEDDLDPTKSLSAMGVDSLVSIEIRNWWRRSLGLDISVLEIMNAGSVARLGQTAVEGLRAKHATTSKKEEQSDTYLVMRAP